MSDGPLSRPQRPWLSILIPVYRAEKYLDACVASVLAQGQEGVEVLLLDDASPDGSAEIAAALCEAHPGRLRLLRHARNAGLSGARNTLLTHASGRYVWHLDADDVLLPGAIDGLRRIVDESSPDLVLCDFSVLRERSGLKHRIRGEGHCAGFDGGSNRVESDRSRLVAGLMRSRCLQAWAKVGRRRVWLEACFPTGRRLMQDVAVMPALVAATRTFLHVRKPWVGYRRHGESAWGCSPGALRLHDAVASLRDLKSGMSGIPGLDAEAKFALDYYCLRSLARISGRIPKNADRRQGDGRDVISDAFDDMFPAGPASTITACHSRGWHMRAWRLRRACELARRGGVPDAAGDDAGVGSVGANR
ncbi:glycosyltransferase family 2 protein [Luteimonas marina]|nr:glycosyltransferase family 2 protein [Luteimonas marina]